MRIALIIVSLFVASVADAEVSQFGNIAGEYTLNATRSCVYDNGEWFTEKEQAKVILAYYNSGMYDVYYIFSENRKYKGFIYVGPNIKAFSSYKDDWGYMFLKENKKGMIKMKSVHMTATDVWTDDGREYSCHVKSKLKMDKKADYVVEE